MFPLPTFKDTVMHVKKFMTNFGYIFVEAYGLFIP